MVTQDGRGKHHPIGKLADRLLILLHLDKVPTEEQVAFENTA